MTQERILPLRRALISVYDKSHIIPFARQLQESGVEILSTGGTANLLTEAGIAVTEVAEYTGFPEIFGGRVKSLHPKIYGALLARGVQDEAVMSERGIVPIDLVVVNLYPFANTVIQPDCVHAQAIEQIDIGGPTMIRAAAKNHAFVACVTDSQDYPKVLTELSANQGLSVDFRFQLAKRAFAYTARYDGQIADYFARHGNDENSSEQKFPERLNLRLERKEILRYGENPHQEAAFYADPLSAGAMASARQHQGAALSFNNIQDADAAVSCVNQFSDPSCVIVKHANPCGVATRTTLALAYAAAYAADENSAFGGIIAFNRCLDVEVAEAIVMGQFVEVIIAPEVSADALEIFTQKPKIRVLSCHSMHGTSKLDIRSVSGGFLLQDADTHPLSVASFRNVSARGPTVKETADLEFALKIVRQVKSNAIVFAKNAQTHGIGAGQMSRVYSTKIASLKAQEAGFDLRGAVLASDAFLPFRDSVDVAAKKGISAIIQPGGSIRDKEIIAAVNELGMAMIFTGQRYFKH